MSEENNSQPDILGIVSLISGLIATISWGCCALLSIAGLGIAALILGFVCALLAVVLGFIGMQRAKSMDQSPVLSIVGMVLGAINLIGIALYCCIAGGAAAAITAFYAYLMVA